MTVRLPNTHFPDNQSGRATWGRAVVDSLRGLVTQLTNYLPLTGGTLTGDLSVPDEAYGVGWNGSTEVPTKNALYDKIETLGGGGGTTTNALTIDDTGGAAPGATFDGSAAITIDYSTVGAAASSHTHAQADVTGLTTADSPQFTAINLGHASDTTLTRVSAGVIAVEGVNVMTTAGGTFSADIIVPDEAYDATNWNGNLEAPTKNAVRDKIESLASVGWALAGTGWAAAGVYDQAVDGTQASVPFTGLAGKTEILVMARALTLGVSGVPLLQVSTNNGSSFFTTSGDYVIIAEAGTEANTTGINLWDTNATAARSGRAMIRAANVIGPPRPIDGMNSDANTQRWFVADLANDIDAVRLIPSAGGNITGGKIWCLAR